MDDLRPVGLAEARETMLRHPGMANAIDFEKLPIDKSILGMNMENPGTKSVDVRYRIYELAHQVAGVPFDADVLAPGFVEEPFPHRGLGEHVIAHDRQVIWQIGRAHV